MEDRGFGIRTCLGLIVLVGCFVGILALFCGLFAGRSSGPVTLPEVESEDKESER